MNELKFIGYCPFYKYGRVEVHRLPVYSITSLTAGWMENCAIDDIEPIINYGYWPDSVYDYLWESSKAPSELGLENSIWTDDHGYTFRYGRYRDLNNANTAWCIYNNDTFVEWYGLATIPRYSNTLRDFIIEYNGSYFPGTIFTTDHTQVLSSNQNPTGDYALVTSLNILKSATPEESTLDPMTSMFLGWYIGKRLARQRKTKDFEILDVNALMAGVVIDTATLRLYDDSSDIPTGISSQELLGTGTPTVILSGDHLIVEMNNDASTEVSVSE